MNKEIMKEKFFDAINEYFKDIQQELIDRWNSWNISMDRKELFEVIGGLLSRQVALTTYLLQSSTNWNPEFAPIIHRVLAENYLTISYILYSDSLEKAKKFRDYGLGREKLIWEKLKREYENQGKLSEFEAQFKESEEYWNQFKYTQYTDINLALWTDKNMREICEEINEKDFYNILDPLNDAVHGTFNHLIKHNLVKSENPLHQYILKPGIKFHQPNIDLVERATLLLDGAFKKVDKFFPLQTEIKSSSDKLFNTIDSLSAEHEKEPAEK